MSQVSQEPPWTCASLIRGEPEGEGGNVVMKQDRGVSRYTHTHTHTLSLYFLVSLPIRSRSHPIRNHISLSVSHGDLKRSWVRGNLSEGEWEGGGMCCLISIPSGCFWCSFTLDPDKCARLIGLDCIALDLLGTYNSLLFSNVLHPTL